MKLQDLIYESEESQMAVQLKAAFDAELKDGEINELLDPVSILGWALTANTVIDVLGKYAAKALRKMNFNKTADKADAIHQWAHANEKSVVNVVATVIKPFVKDPTKRQLIAKGLFIALLAAFGLQAGIGALKAIRGANVGSAALSMTKTALKGRDIAHVGKEILQAL
jgi:hypothetical protein